MSGVLLIRDLAVVLVIAGGAAWLCQRLRLSAIVGYLVAGAVIGPHTPPFALVTDPERVRTLADVGLVFLMFSVGMNLSLSRLKNLGLSVIAATAISAILILNGCRLFGWAMGWSVTASLFLAGMLMVSSSAIISKVLEELNLTHERPGQMALGATVVEDAVAVAMLTLLTSLIQFGGNPPLLRTLAALGAFVVLLALVSLLLAPKLLALVSRDAPAEVRTLVVVGSLLTLSWLAVQAGYSLALGAFVFGAIVGSTRYRTDIERGVGGLHQVFGAVFFVAVGMQLDFRVLLGAWPLVLAVTGLALVLRPVAAALGFMAVGNRARESLQTGLSLTPLGEFSFIIAQLGVEAGVVPEHFYSVAVGSSLLTSLAAPVLTRRAEGLSLRLVRHEPRFATEWLAFYHGWLLRLWGHQSTNVLWRLTRGRLVQIALHILFVSALILLANPVYAKARELAGREGLLTNGLPFLFWSAFGLVLLGPLIAIWRNVSALAMMVAESATGGTPRQARLRPLLETALRTVAFVVLVAWLLTLLPSGGSLLGAAGAVILLLGIVAAVFWRRLVRLHSRLEIELSEQLKRASHATATSAWPDALPAQSADWDLEIDEVSLPGDSAHAGQTIGQLGLRTRFGCTIVGIDRQGFGLVNPGAETALYPHDKLLLLGAPAQLAEAAKTLGLASAPTAVPTGFEALTLESVAVPESCPLAGTALRELDLIRRAGVQIGAVRGPARRNLAPSGHDRFEAGDELLVLGTHARIQAFRALLAAPPDSARTPAP